MSNQRLPIVLAHGIARFDILLQNLRTKLNVPDTEFGDRFQYFKLIKTHLESHGFQVFHPNEDFAGPVDLRAEQLRARVNEALAGTGAPKVNIIAHSMGGLDARHMIVDKGMADKVATLVTIGTPHLGTILADHVIDNGGFFLQAALRQVVNLDGFNDLRITRCDEFNRRAEDQEATNDVQYRTFAGAEDGSLVFFPLKHAWDFIRDHAGRNDGLVPVTSQAWARELIANDGRRKQVVQNDFPIPADHLNEVGWWDIDEIANPLKRFQNVFKEQEDYERQIRDVYLQIAESL
ncbi:MAG TPA: alpha/beta fold hydrolase [Pyrinomonadaceae bacterium]|nr:alpha/beta fold hydrolase [Pyrinomonadaceae bacterium]